MSNPLEINKQHYLRSFVLKNNSLNSLHIMFFVSIFTVMFS